MSTPSQLVLAELSADPDVLPPAGALGLYAKTSAEGLYTINSAGTVVGPLGAGGGGGTPGGADSNVQFNSSGSFAGDANFTFTTGGGNTTLHVDSGTGGGGTTSLRIGFDGSGGGIGEIDFGNFPFASIVGTGGTISLNAANGIKLNGTVGSTGQVFTSKGASNQPLWGDPAPVFTLGTLPTAIAGQMITVSDANAGAGALCYSLGATWLDAGTHATVV